MNRLAGKVAIVTGAASGQGAAEARLFAAEGARVVLTDMNETAGKKVAETIGASAIFVRHDVSQEEDWKNVVASARSAFKRLDILVNNAGVYRPTSFQDSDAKLLDFHYQVNARGVFLGMRAVHPVMAQAGQGSIVNIASGAGARGYPGLFAYAASKWMVRGMSKCAAVDLAASGIRVNTILPGLIDTPMLGENPPGYIEELSKLVPFGRLGTVDEVANAVLFLASDEARYVSGTEFSVCGALMA